jgi:RimJ/RimL family protein N-acetyltransferase
MPYGIFFARQARGNAFNILLIALLRNKSLIGGFTMISLLTEDDKAKVIRYLERDSIAGACIMGNVLEFGLDNQNEQRRCGDYYGYFSKGNLLGILPFYNMGSCMPLWADEAVIEPFAEIMLQYPFEFLIGMEKTVKPLYDIISGEKNILAYQDSSYFVNDRFSPFTLENITFATADELNHDSVVDFVKHAYWQGFGHSYSFEETQQFVSQRAAEEEFLFLIVEDQIVAQAYIQAATSKINQIGGVFTLGEERGKGYCKAILSELCQHIIARGKMPTLIVRNDNFPAIRAYTSLGFTHFDDYLLIKLKR